MEASAGPAGVTGSQLIEDEGDGGRAEARPDQTKPKLPSVVLRASPCSPTSFLSELPPKRPSSGLNLIGRSNRWTVWTQSSAEDFYKAGLVSELATAKVIKVKKVKWIIRGDGSRGQSDAGQQDSVLLAGPVLSVSCRRDALWTERGELSDFL